MATQDITRDAFEPRKQYVDTRLQQGQVLTDEDFNEQGRISLEDERRSLVEIVGPAGSPDDGYHISNPRLTAGNLIDFDVEAGAFYLGGRRLELHDPDTFLTLRDSLQFPADRFPAPAAERFDLVVLKTYQVAVSPIEDNELFEVGLGGPETSTRLRNMQRLLLIEDVGTDSCAEAWQALLDQWAAANMGALNEDHELVPDTTLTISFAPGGLPDDLCTPAAGGGYLGAENQAIRVQLVDDDHLTWGFDNAAPLYRVELAADRQTVTLLNEPRDQAHWMLAGQTVEILPWAAVLPNGEKVAEIGGHLSRVSAPYDPDSGALTLTTPVPAGGFDDWQFRSDAADLSASGAYYFLRVWNRGADTTADPAIPFTAGTPVPLGQTGLEVTINGQDRVPGDHWIIAARKETTNQVVPWELESGREKHGYRTFFAPLAIVHWTGDANGTATAHDCRRRFRPLTEQDGCCTFDVGDGMTSHGHYNDLEEALQHLPDAGGEICLLPGEHQVNVVIENRHNIKISGCGKETRVIPRLDRNDNTLFTILDSQCITLEHMEMVTVEGTAVDARGTSPGALEELVIAHNRILALTNAVHVVQGETIQIEHNIIRMLDKDEGDVAIFVLADDVRIERNDIGVVPAGTTPPEPDDGDDDERPDPSDPCAEPEAFYFNPAYMALYLSYIWTNFLVFFFPTDPYKTLGGIQIGSGSERVLVRDNQINGGAGNGITLGSDLEAADLPPDEEEERPAPRAFEISTLEEAGVWGGVTDGREPLTNVGVALRSNRRVVPAVTDDDGAFLVDAEPDTYEVLVTDPNYRIRSVQPLDRGEFGRFHQINVVAVQPRVDPLDVLAFIYDVTIAENRIVNMGESGIGVPFAELGREGARTAPANLTAAPVSATGAAAVGATSLRANPGVAPILDHLVRGLGLLTGFVVDLQIEDNEIERCLTNIFNLEAEEEARRSRGVGGISLGLCERLTIRHNRIYENGQTYRGPAHGIYIFYASESNIVENQIIGNGPPTNSPLQVGETGGLRVVFSTVLGGFGFEERETGVSFPRQALRVHGNVVEQPLGRAMTLWAIGPVHVTDNVFSTHLARTLSDAGGAQPTTTVGPSPLQILIFGALNAGAVLVLNLGLAAYLQRAGRDVDSAGLTMPTGHVLFNDNQTRLAGADNVLVSLALLSLDDISFSGNQADVLDDANLLVNAFAFAPTVRAANNRLQESVS